MSKLTQTTRLILVVSLSGLYILLFIRLSQFFGSSIAGMFSLVPVMVAALFWGMRGGVLCSLVLVLLSYSTAILVLRDSPNGVQIQSGVIGTLGLIFSGVTVGYLSDLSTRYRAEIAERKRVEAALKASESRNTQAVELSPNPIYSIDAEGRIITWNRACQKVFQYGQEILGDHFSCLFDDTEGSDLAADLFARVYLDGTSFTDLEFAYRRQDGTQWTALTRLYPLTGPDGKVLSCVFANTDISERKRVETSLARRAQEMAALYATSLEINAQMDLETLLSAVVQRAALLVGARMGGLYLLKEDGQTLELAVNYNLPDNFKGATLRLGEGLSGRIAQTGEALAVEDYLKWEGRASLYANGPFRRVLGVPLKVGERILGVINVTDDEMIGPFSPEDIRLVSLFADQAAIAVEKARLYEAVQRELSERVQVEQALRESEQRFRDLFAKAQRQAQELSLLEQVSAALARQVDLPAILHTVVEAVAQTFDFQLVSFYLLQEEVLILQHQVGYTQVIHSIPLAEGVIGRAARTGQPVLLEDARADPEFLGAFPGIVSEIAIPLLHGEKVIGVLNVESIQGVKLGEPDLRLLTMLGEHVRIAFERARLYEEVRESEERFRKIFEEGPLGMAVVSTDYRYLRVNATFCSMLGYSEQELTELTFPQLTHPDDREADEALARQVFSGQAAQCRLEKRFIKKNGQILWADLTAALIRDENGIPQYALNMIEDITERKRVEAAEREQRVLAEALRDTAAALTSTPHLDEVLDRILANVGRVVPHEQASIMLVESGVARVVGCRGITDPEREKAVLALRFEVAEMLSLRRMAETGQPLLIPDTRTFPGWVDVPATIWIRGYLGAPIRIKGQAVGFLNLTAATAGYFTPEQGERLQAFAHQAAIALENARLFAEVQRFARHMALLNEITQVAIRAPDLTAMLQTLADRLGELFDADGIYIALWDEAEERSIPAAAFGPLRDKYASIGLEPGERTMTHAVLSAGRVLAAEDVMNSPLLDAHIAAEFPGRSLLGIPLIADGRKLGAALINYQDSHRFTPREMELGQEVASQLSLAIAKVMAFEAERQRTDELERTNNMIMALGQVAARIETAPDPDGVMETLGAELVKQGLNCLVTLRAADSDHLVPRYISINPKRIAQIEKLLGREWLSFYLPPERFPFYETVMIQRKPVFREDWQAVLEKVLPDLPGRKVNRFSRMIGLNRGTRWIVLPLAVEDQVLGALWVWGEGLVESDLRGAGVFASQVATALENARLYAKTQQLAITDELTGLYNRRGLFELGQREVERSLRFNHPLSALILDIDHFKDVNDHYSHAAGDQVLRTLATRCRTNIRDVDIIGRYGGDEFVILFPETGQEAAHKVAERLWQTIHQSPFRTAEGDIPITVSLGVAELDRQGQDLATLIDCADGALYTAKNSGRNRVVVN